MGGTVGGRAWQRTAVCGWERRGGPAGTGPLRGGRSGFLRKSETDPLNDPAAPLQLRTGKKWKPRQQVFAHLLGRKAFPPPLQVLLVGLTN